MFAFLYEKPAETSVAEKNRIPSEGLDILKEKEWWTGRIKDAGPPKAYDELKEEYALKRYDHQHSIAHLFGALLYEMAGDEGIGVCDDSFGFGCFHGFFVEALGDRGIDVITDLDQACKDKFGVFGTGCQHGIGHGLIEYFGHRNLMKALEACKLVDQKIKIFGCTSGVFMEYNIPVSLNVSVLGLQSRDFNQEKPHFPCNEVPEEFKESCFFELGQWLKQALKSDYNRIGGICSLVVNQLYKERCYLGIGHIAGPTTGYDVDAIIDKCNEVSGSEGKLLCKAGATWSLFGNLATRHDFRKVCRSYDGGMYEQCLVRADLMGNNGETFKNF